VQGLSGAYFIPIGVGVLLASPSSLLAQTAVGQWSGVASTTNVARGDGFLADAVEVAGHLRLTILLNGERVSELRIVLATDGSGKAETSGIAGRVIHEVAAGTGKRLIISTQVEGVCQWLWKPT
jgi:hypothetical protein